MGKRKQKGTIFTCMFTIGVFLLIGGFGLPGSAMAKSVSLTIATATMSGNWYPLGGGIAKIINDSFPGKYTATVVTSSGTQENTRRIDKGQVQLALGSARQCYEAWKGLPPLFKKPLKVAGITAHYGAFNALLVSAKSGVKTISDIKKKKAKISTYLPGHELNLLATNYVLKPNGVEVSDFKRLQYDMTENLANFKDGHIDGFFANISVGMGSIVELARTRDLVWVEFGQAAFDAVGKSPFAPFYTVDTLPADSFPNQPAYTSLGYRYQIICDPGLSEEVVYNVTKALWENMEQIYAINPGFKAGTFENACRNLVVPPHPGALKYYKEKGINLGKWGK
jgi:uncharacterized protein